MCVYCYSAVDLSCYLWLQLLSLGINAIEFRHNRLALSRSGLWHWCQKWDRSREPSVERYITLLQTTLVWISLVGLYRYLFELVKFSFCISWQLLVLARLCFALLSVYSYRLSCSFETWIWFHTCTRLDLSWWYHHIEWRYTHT